MVAHDRLKRQLVAALKAHLTSSWPARLPEAGRLAWQWFAELSASRSYGMAGPDPLSFAEIEAWARLKRWPLEERHVDLIWALDRTWIDHAYARQPNASERPAQAINPAAFDAVFG